MTPFGLPPVSTLRQEPLDSSNTSLSAKFQGFTDTIDPFQISRRPLHTAGFGWPQPNSMRTDSGFRVDSEKTSNDSIPGTLSQEQCPWGILGTACLAASSGTQFMA